MQFANEMIKPFKIAFTIIPHFKFNKENIIDTVPSNTI